MDKKNFKTHPIRHFSACVFGLFQTPTNTSTTTETTTLKSLVTVQPSPLTKPHLRCPIVLLVSIKQYIFHSSVIARLIFQMNQSGLAILAVFLEWYVQKCTALPWVDQDLNQNS